MIAPDLLRHPDDAKLYGRLGNALRARGEPARALPWYRRGTVLAPGLAPMHGALANAAAELGDLDGARHALLTALRLAPERLDLHQNLANLARRAGRPEQAVRALSRAALALPGTGAAYVAMASLAAEEAWEAKDRLLRRALAIDPADAAAATNLGIILRDASRAGAGAYWHRRALVAQPTLTEALNGIANALRARGEAGLAMRWFARALAAAPRSLMTRSNLLMTLQYQPGIDAAALNRAHRGHAPAYGRPAPAVRRLPGRPLRLTLVSPNLNRHPVGRLVAGLVEHHDPADIAIHCVSDTLIADSLTERLRAASDGWTETRGLDDSRWADCVRGTAPDVLVDLAGHTAANRLGPLAARLAPVQASWAGYVGTTGLEAMDLLVADRFHVPPGEDPHYAERILRLPNGYATYTPPDDAPEPGPPPMLADGRVTFASFNNPVKLNRPLAELWARVLHAVPGSRLLLLYRGLDEPWTAASIRSWFAAEGISADRLLFERGGPPQRVAEGYRRADIALDTRPYSGGVTTLEALWMGVPVVTWPGDSFAGRHSASHLANAGYPDLVAPDADGFVATAASLARDPGRLAGFRAGARAVLRASPLMDHAGFARDFARCLRDTLGK